MRFSATLLSFPDSAAPYSPDFPSIKDALELEIANHQHLTTSLQHWTSKDVVGDSLPELKDSLLALSSRISPLDTGQESLTAERQKLRQQLSEVEDALETLQELNKEESFYSIKMRELEDQLQELRGISKKASERDTGLIQELLAEAIHLSSPRKDESFIKLNCAALPSELLESELFGHEKGAFTGAVQAKKGRFELSDKGTLFLDEIGELSGEAQAKLLRAIQEGEIQRLGSEKTIHVDVRLVCATHRPLEELLEKGQFREDLYYRINVFPIFIPPLRERRDDILPLAEHFLQDFSREYGKNLKRISTPAIDLLVQYHWPGNVRELRNSLERAVLLCNDEVIRTYHLPPSLQTAESSATDSDLSFGEVVADFEKEVLIDALKKSRGNMLQAARDLRASYRVINYKVKKYRIDSKKFAGS